MAANFAIPAFLGGLLLLLAGGRRRDGEDEARRALGASDAEARDPRFTSTTDRRGRVILPSEGDITQTRGRDVRSSPATATPAARAALCAVPPENLALSGSDAGHVLRTWVACEGRTRTQVRTLLDRIDAREREAGEPQRSQYAALRREVNAAVADAAAAGTLVAGLVDVEPDPALARQIVGAISRSLRAATDRTHPRDDVRHFQAAAGIEATGLYTPETRAAFQYYGDRAAPPSQLPGAPIYRRPKQLAGRRYAGSSYVRGRSDAPHTQFNTQPARASDKIGRQRVSTEQDDDA